MSVRADSFRAFSGRLGVGAVVCLLASALGNEPIAGQSLLVVDLAEDGGDTTTVIAGDYRVQVINRLPSGEYVVNVQHGYEAIPPIETPDVTAMGGTCEEVEKSIDEFEAATSEGDIPAISRRAATVIGAHRNDAGCASMIVKAQAYIDTTSVTYPTIYEVGAGEYVDVTVSRRSGEAKSWTRRFTTGARGRWNLSYGYAFPVLVGVGGGDLTGEAQRIRLEGDSGSYIVTETPSQPRIDMAPSVFMSFLPTQVGNWHLNLLSGGFSLDLKTPQAFFGPSVTYASNLVLTLGIGVREEQVPQYEEGDTVTESLTDDQLHGDEFRVRPFFAVTYRFEGNPFSGSTEEETEDTEADTAEQPAEEQEPADDTESDEDEGEETTPDDEDSDTDPDEDQ